MFSQLTESAKDFILETVANLLKQQRKDNVIPNNEESTSKKSGAG